MKQGGSFNCLEQVIVTNAYMPGQTNGVGLNAPNMSVRDLVFGVDRHRQRLDRRHIQAVQLSKVLMGVNSPTGLPTKR